MNDQQHQRIRAAIKKNTRTEITLLILGIIALGIFFLLLGCDNLDAHNDRRGGTNTIRL